MIRFLCSSSRSAFLRSRVQLFQLQFDFVELCCHQNHPFVTNFKVVRSFASKGLSNSDEQQDVLSSSVSYLVKSCGLPTEYATRICKYRLFKLDLKNPEKADSVLRSLRDHGFTDAHVTRFVRKCPELLRADPDKNLKPMFEFFYSKGISRSELPTILASNPTLLHRSLQNNLIPLFNFLKSVSCLDDHKVIMALRHWQRSSGPKASNSLHDNLVPNLALLRGLGVPQASISLLLTCYLNTACCERTKFGELVDKVKEMGFNSNLTSFVKALHVVSTVKEPRWESKIEVYRRYGWSREDVLSAFRRCPWFMHASEKKIEMVLDFVINKMGWSTQDIDTWPTILSLSLEKRIMPRCYVGYVLSSKGIIKKDVKLSSLINHTEKDFLQKFVTKYGEDVPELLDVYQGKINPLEATV